MTIEHRTTKVGKGFNSVQPFTYHRYFLTKPHPNETSSWSRKLRFLGGLLLGPKGVVVSILGPPKTQTKQSDSFPNRRYSTDTVSPTPAAKRSGDSQWRYSELGGRPPCCRLPAHARGNDPSAPPPPTLTLTAAALRFSRHFSLRSRDAARPRGSHFPAWPWSSPTGKSGPTAAQTPQKRRGGERSPSGGRRLPAPPQSRLTDVALDGDLLHPALQPPALGGSRHGVERRRTHRARASR